MPILYEYVPNSDRGDGYYVKLDYEGAKTYQTHSVAENLYDELGYSAKTDREGGGDYIPTRLFWALENVGLHYTNDEDTEEGDGLDESELPDLEQLSEEEWEELRKRIREYVPKRNDERLWNLAEKLNIEIDAERREVETTEGEKEVTTVNPAMLRIGYELPETVVDAVKDWLIYKPADESLELIEESESAQESIRQMHQHPWEVCRVGVSEEKIEYYIPGSSIEYLNFSGKTYDGLIVYDYLQFTTGDEFVSTPPKKTEGVDYRIQFWNVDYPNINYSDLMLRDGWIVGDIDSGSDEGEYGVEVLDEGSYHDNVGTALLLITCAEFAEKLEGYETNRPKLESLLKWFD